MTYWIQPIRLALAPPTATSEQMFVTYSGFCLLPASVFSVPEGAILRDGEWISSLFCRTPSAATAKMSSSKAAMMFIRFCIQYSSVAVLYYDYALTWTREVQHFWLRKFSLSTALYIAFRYGMVANVIYTLALAEKLPTLRSEILLCLEWTIAAILACIGRTAIVVVWGARTYAVFDRNKWILAIFTLFGLTVIGLAILHIPYVACNGNRGTPPGAKRGLLPGRRARWLTVD
ncbi:unnamed protein product [Cyclocybe aegerita]|uniref:DUF6533 domain-containing protein n=1 Tax=Cyclocybe aegerita TaxID=1973307 RepID=A0A8S0W2A6_CYCAE|nr:unnamed protein product [Cyclocybe aegerita]